MKKNRLLALGLCLTMLAGCSGTKPAPSNETTQTPAAEATATPTPAPTATPEPEQTETVRVSMLKGPTGLGAAKLMERAENGETINHYDFTVLAEPTEAVAKLTGGEVDIAALPTNLASTLYHKTDGGVQLLALNTLGVLYILENGSTVNSVNDLTGRKLIATGQGANPEFVLNYLLEENGIDPEKDLDIEWLASDEVSTRMASGEAELCMLPVPAATSVMMQNGDVRAALDLNDVWADVGAEGVLTMGCVVVRTEFARENPEAVDTFLKEYGESIEFMSGGGNLDEAAVLAERFGIVPKAAVAKKALPDANLCFITGDDMMADIQGYYQVLASADPTSIGGSIPDGAFYYEYNK